MKRVLLMICSIALVLACVFGLFSCVAGIKDILNINDYKNADSEVANAGIATARDGLAQLKENEQTYLEGAETYVSGLAQLASARGQLAAGEQQLADGQAQIDANTQAYLEGKEKIATLESFMPLINGIADAMQNVRDFNKGIIGGDADQALGELRANVLGLLANGAAVAAISDLIGMDVGSLLAANPTDTSICGSVVAMYNDGLAQLKQYEDGLAALAQGKQDLANGYAQYAAGQQQLKEGNEQLMVYEDGEKQIVDGMRQLMGSMIPSYYQKSFVPVEDAPSLPELLAQTDAMKTDIPVLFPGDKFDEAAYGQLVDALVEKLYAVDENGERVVVRDNDHVNLDNCLLVCDKAEEYSSLQEADIKGEVYVRIGIYAALAIAAILGLVAGIMGFVASITGGKKTGKVLGIISAVLGVGALIAGIVSGFGDYCYAIRVDDATGAYATAMEGTHLEYSGDMQHKAIILFAIVAVVFAVVAAIAKKAAKNKEAKVAVEVNQAAAAGAAATAMADDRLAKLEAENAELKAMVADLAADAATVKE